MHLYAMNYARNGKICRFQCEIFGWNKKRFKVLRNDKFHYVSRRPSICVIRENAGMIVPLLWRIVDGLSSRRSYFRTGSIIGVFLVDKIALGQNPLLVCRFSPVNIIRPKATNF